MSQSRTQSWSTSISAGFTFEEIFSLGVSEEFSESETSTKTITVPIGEGQSGKLGFTATMSCRSGSGECDGEEVSGEVCCESNLPVGVIKLNLICNRAYEELGW